MKLHRVIGFAALSSLVVSCYGPIGGSFSCASEEEDPYADLRPTTSVEAAPDGGPAQPAPGGADSTSDESAFVPAADDLIFRIAYGDAMVGPGWLRVELIDPGFPNSRPCATTHETSSEEGLSVFGIEDYVCLADVFNGNAINRTNPQDFTLVITSSFGYEQSYDLTWQDGSFTNAAGNVLTYSVP